MPSTSSGRPTSGPAGGWASISTPAWHGARSRRSWPRGTRSSRRRRGGGRGRRCELRPGQLLVHVLDVRLREVLKGEALVLLGQRELRLGLLDGQSVGDRFLHPAAQVVEVAAE